MNRLDLLIELGMLQLTWDHLSNIFEGLVPGEPFRHSFWFNEAIENFNRRKEIEAILKTK